MKKLFIGLIIVALCAQPIIAMKPNAQIQKKTQKKELSSDASCSKLALACCAILLSALLVNSLEPADAQNLRKEWSDMQNDCWDPCLEQPYYSHQRVKYQDHWLERVWDTRAEKYRDELNCPNLEQDLQQLRFEGCAWLETLEATDQSALACVSDIQAHGLNLTTTIIDQQAEIDRRAIARKDCLEWPLYLKWKEERQPKYAPFKFRWIKESIPAPLDPGVLCGPDSPYFSTQYHSNQPYVVDISRCRTLEKSDCPKDYIPDFGRALIAAFARKKQCDTLSDANQENKDGEEVSQETIHTLIRAGSRWHNAPAYRPSSPEGWAKRECPIWNQELEKKDQ